MYSGEVLEVDEAYVEYLDRPVKVYNFEVEDWHTYFVSEYNVFVHNTVCGDSGVSSGENSQTSKNTGRGKNKIKSDPNAQGAHSVYKRDPVTRKITNYRTYKPNPKSPSGFDEVLGYDGVGKPHVNKITGESLLPHVHDKTVPGGVRAPYPYEIPK